MKKKRKLVLMGMLTIAIALVMGLTSLPGIAESKASITEDDGCTQFIIVGRPSWDFKNRGGGTSDTVPESWKAIRLVMNEETGIKVLCEVRVGSTKGQLNSYGVTRKGGARPGPVGSVHKCGGWTDANEGFLLEWGYMKADYPDAKAPALNYVFEHARSAREAVDMFVKTIPEGTYEITIVKDAALAHSNFFLSPSGLLQPFNIRKEYSENRAERVQELLDERSWLKSTAARGEISTAYLFSVLRDHRFEFDAGATYDHDNRGNISRWGSIERTRAGIIFEIPKDYTDLLSIYFTTPNWPLTSPFLPFYIGITEVPKTLAEGPTNESGVFQELFNAVSYNLESLDEVQAFWEAFDHNTIRDKVQLEKAIVKLVDAGNREEAEKLLTEFCNDRCELAVVYAKALTKEIVSRGIIEVDISVYVP